MTEWNSPITFRKISKKKTWKLKNKKENKNTKNFDTSNEGFRRIRKLTEKSEENIRRLKQRFPVNEPTSTS